MGLWRGAITCVGWQVTLCDPIWQVMPRSSVMGFPLRAILGFNLFNFYMPTVSPDCRLCINIHHYVPPQIVLQQAAALDALCQKYSSEGSMSSFKSITRNEL